jgi:hypothetical protein
MASGPKREEFLLDIWDTAGKVLGVAWNDGEPINIIQYRRKDWETYLDDWAKIPSEFGVK